MRAKSFFFKYGQSGQFSTFLVNGTHTLNVQIFRSQKASSMAPPSSSILQSEEIISPLQTCRKWQPARLPVREIFCLWGNLVALIIYILNSRVPILGKLIKKLISPFNIDDILMGNICIILFPPISNKFDKRRFCLDVSKILFACFFGKYFLL